MANPTTSSTVLHNILTFWCVGKGCTVGNHYQLTQCFLDESPQYRRVRLLTLRQGQRMALLQSEVSKKSFQLLAPYGIYTYKPSYKGHEALFMDGTDKIYQFAQLVPTQFQGFQWEYQRILGKEQYKTLCKIKVRPRGFKFHCQYLNQDKTVIAQSLQPNSNRYNDWGETFDIHACQGVDEIAILLISTALEDHRDRLNNANRGKSASFVPINGYTPPLERTKNIRGFTQGFCS